MRWRGGVWDGCWGGGLRAFLDESRTDNARVGKEPKEEQGGARSVLTAERSVTARAAGKRGRDPRGGGRPKKKNGRRARRANAANKTGPRARPRKERPATKRLLGAMGPRQEEGKSCKGDARPALLSLEIKAALFFFMARGEGGRDGTGRLFKNETRERYSRQQRRRWRKRAGGGGGPPRDRAACSQESLRGSKEGRG